MDEVSPWQQLGYQKDLLAIFAIFVFLGEGFIDCATRSPC